MKSNPHLPGKHANPLMKNVVTFVASDTHKFPLLSAPIYGTVLFLLNMQKTKGYHSVH